MKKAFTLSEALVTLAILGVLAAILIPVIDNVRPDKDKITYKKALYSMQNAVSNAMDSTVYSIAANSSAYWKDENIAEDAFCQSIAEALNTAGPVDCTSVSSYENPNFRTTDGIRFWGLEGKVFTDEGANPVNTREIFVDRALTTGELKTVQKNRGRDDVGLKIRIHYDGKVDTGDDNYELENDLIDNSLQVTKNKY